MKLIIKFLLFVLIYLKEYNCGHNEKRLLQHLFNNSRSDSHNILERPVQIEKDSIKVGMMTYLIQLIDVDLKNQMIQINMWIEIKWPDYHFQWNPALFNGVNKVSVQSDRIWKPDIILFNNADENLSVTYPVNVVIYSDSSIVWIPPGVFKSTCQMDVSWFPFDNQICILKFGSWTYNSNSLDLKIECGTFSYENCSIYGSIDLTYYKINSEFELKLSSLERKEDIFSNESYSYINVNIGFKRKSFYYVCNLIIPCILVSIMSLFVFVLPPDAGEKISLGVTVLLSMTMFLLLISDKLPQTSDALPKICMYFLFIMVLCSISIFFTVVVLIYHHKSSNLKPMSKISKYFIHNILGKILCMKMEIKPNYKKEGLLDKCINFCEDQKDQSSSEEMSRILFELIKITNKISDDDLKELMANEWKFASRVIDRTCLVVFSLFSFISAVTLLSSVP